MTTQHLLRTKWDRLDPAQRERLQIRRLRHYLESKVLPFSSFYRELFREHDLRPRDIRTRADLARIPTTSKRDLLNSPEHPERSRDFILIPDQKILARRPSTIARALLRGRARVQRELGAEFRPILMTSTTGRSSDPVPFLYTQYDIDNLTRAGIRLMEICGSQRDHRHMNLFPFAPHLAFWQAHYAGTGFNAFNLSTGGGKALGTSANVGLLGKIKPDALVGMPTFIYHLLQQAAEADLDCPNIVKIVLGGEKVPAGTRRKLRALCAELGAGKVDVMATYGFTEAKMAFPECPAPAHGEPTGYHLFADMGLVEIVDPESGEPVPEGEPGEIVYTALDSRGSLVLRYRTGDRIDGGLVNGICPACGRNVARLMGRISRVSDIRRMRIDKIKGTLVNFNDLENILDDLEHLGAWQIELRKVDDDPLERDQLIVHAHRAGRIPEKDLRRDIERRFLAATEIRPNEILFHDAAAMRERQGVGDEIKELRFLDNRPAARSQESVKAQPATRNP